MEIGDIVLYGDCKGVITRTFLTGATTDIPYATVWLGNQIATVPQKVLTDTGDKCPQIVGILNILNQKEKTNEK